MLTSILFLVVIIIGFITFKIYLKKTQQKKAGMIILKKGAIVVDGAIESIVQDLDDYGIALDGKQGTSVADVWGVGVVAFNYHAKMNREINIDEIKNKIDTLLNSYCHENNLVNQNEALLRVSDIWNNENELNFDIIYLINDATKNYFKDLKRL